METVFRGTIVVMNLDEYDYLRSLNIMEMPQYKDIDIHSTMIWALNPERIYVNAALLRHNFRLMYMAHKVRSQYANDELMQQLETLINAPV